MIDAICKEIRMRKDYLPESEVIKSIYFGGGTPSLLDEKELSQILSSFEEVYDLSEVEEITLEANPDDIDSSRLDQWKLMGINRLSIGVQSFDDDILKFLNRVHNSKEAISSIRTAQKFNFHNLNLDLIYGIPGQTINSLNQSIDQLLDLNPTHISAYCLTIEENTVFGRWSKSNKIKAVEEDILSEHYNLVINRLFENGFEQYEVSNFSLPGKESLHNSSYWKQDSYLGIGPSAHSFNTDSRQINVANNAQYIKSINKNELPAEVELLTTDNKFEEYVLTSIRTKWGVDLERIEENFGLVPKSSFANFIKHSIEAGYIEVANNHIYLTPKGKLIADEVTVRFFDHFL